MNKIYSKGQVDILTMVIVLFVIAFISIMGLKVLNTFNDTYQDINNSSASSQSKTALSSYTSNYASGLDQGITIALGFVFVLTLVFAGMINTNPAYFWIFLFILIIVLGVAAILPQVFDNATNNSDFSVERNQMPLTTWIATNLFQLAVAMAVFIMVVLFAKIRKGGS